MFKQLNEKVASFIMRTGLTPTAIIVGRNAYRRIATEISEVIHHEDFLRALETGNLKLWGMEIRALEPDDMIVIAEDKHGKQIGGVFFGDGIEPNRD